VGLLLTWRDEVSAAADDGALVVTGPGARVSLRGLGPGVLDALRRLEPPGEDEDRLAGAVGGNGDLPRWFYSLERLTRRDLVARSAHENGTRLATLVAVSPSFTWKPVSPAAGRGYVLSRFAYLHREGNQAVVESPLAHARVVLDDCRAAAVVGALAVPTAAEELARRVGLTGAGACGVLTLLLRAGMLCEAGAGEDPALRTWAFHDLLFHGRIRKGRSDAPYGGTYRFVGELLAPPAVKPVPAGESIPLDRPDLERLERDDPPLAWVQEHRRSVREFDGDRPVTAGQLGEFLFRVNRVTERREDEIPTARGPVVLDFAPRPYPAEGAAQAVSQGGRGRDPHDGQAGPGDEVGGAPQDRGQDAPGRADRPAEGEVEGDGRGAVRREVPVRGPGGAGEGQVVPGRHTRS
jgi:hypothetical protein